MPQEGDASENRDGSVEVAENITADHASSDEDGDERSEQKESQKLAKANVPSVTAHRQSAATANGGVPSKAADGTTQPKSKRRKGPRPLTQEELLQNLEAGWSLAPLHQFERTLPAPGGNMVALSPRHPVLQRSPRGQPSAVLPPIPSPPSRGSPRGRTNAPSQELMEARQYAQMWLKETTGSPSSSHGSSKASATGGTAPVACATSGNAEAELVAPPAWATLSMGVSRRNSLSPTRDSFAVPPRDGNFLFEGKRGYEPVPAYMDRIAMSNKLKSTPFHLRLSPSPNYGHSSSRPSTRDELGSRRSARGHHLPGPV